MSVSKWAYSPAKCDGDYCPGDCDDCRKAEYFYDLHKAEDKLIESDWGDMEVKNGKSDG